MIVPLPQSYCRVRNSKNVVTEQKMGSCINIKMLSGDRVGFFLSCAVNVVNTDLEQIISSIEASFLMVQYTFCFLNLNYCHSSANKMAAS